MNRTPNQSISASTYASVVTQASVVNAVTSLTHLTSEDPAVRYAACKEKLDSLMIGESMVDVLLDQVYHIKKMEEIEKKMLPYVIQNTFHNGMRILSDVMMKSDPRRDDCYF